MMRRYGAAVKKNDGPERKLLAALQLREEAESNVPVRQRPDRGHPGREKKRNASFAVEPPQIVAVPAQATGDRRSTGIEQQRRPRGKNSTVHHEDQDVRR